MKYAVSKAEESSGSEAEKSDKKAVLASFFFQWRWCFDPEEQA